MRIVIKVIDEDQKTVCERDVRGILDFQEKVRRNHRIIQNRWAILEEDYRFTFKVEKTREL